MVVKITYKILEDGEEKILPYDISGSTNIVAKLVKYYNNTGNCVYEHAIGCEKNPEHNNYLIIEVNEKIPTGSYGLEVTGVDEFGKIWRFKLKPGELFQIVDATSASSYEEGAYINFDVEIGVIGTNTPSSGYVTKAYVDEKISNINSQIGALDNRLTTTEGAISNIPTKTSQLTNDSGFLTEHQKLKTINGESIVGEGNITISGSGVTSYNDLTDKPTIPTKTSQLTNDSGFLTEHQDISGKANTSDLSAVALSGSYNDLNDKPTIPTNTSQLTNDSGFLTEHQDISGKANISDLATVALSGSYNDLNNKPTIPTNTSQLTNDSGFLTEHQKLKTINNEPIVGEGNITISGGVTSYNDLTDKPTIPTNTSELTNNSGFITSTTSGLKIEVVTELPTPQDSNTIYIVQ